MPGRLRAVRAAHRSRRDRARRLRGRAARSGSGWWRSGTARRAARRAPRSCSSPRQAAEQRLLEHVLSVLHRAQHPVAVQLQLAAEGVGELAKRLLVARARHATATARSRTHPRIHGFDGGHHAFRHPIAEKGAQRGSSVLVARERPLLRRVGVQTIRHRSFNVRRRTSRCPRSCSPTAYRRSRWTRPWPSPTTPAGEARSAAWIGWFQSLGSSVVEIGNPVNDAVGRSARRPTPALGGYSLIDAPDAAAAAELAKGCPAVEFGGGVEIGDIVDMSGAASNGARAAAVRARPRPELSGAGSGRAGGFPCRRWRPPTGGSPAAGGVGPSAAHSAGP